MKKIIHILESTKFSGAENLVCQIIDMFINEDEYEHIYCSPNGQISEILKNKNIKHVCINKLSPNEIRKIVNKYKPDIIHAHDAKASVISSIVCIFNKKIKLISHIHGNHDNMKIMTIKSLLYLALSIRFNKIIWVSNSSLNCYKYNRFIKEKSIILYNVIDEKKVKDAILNEVYIKKYDCIFLGRLCDIKDPFRLIKILNLVRSKVPDLKAVIVGNGNLYEDCKKLITSLDLNSNVELLGFRDNPYPILQNSKCIILTSKYEGTPMCGLEAMSLGIPIVSTPTDGMVDLVDDGITGYLSNSNDMLVKFIVDIITNDKLQIRLSKSTKSKFNKINDINKYKEIIKSIYD